MPLDPFPPRRVLVTGARGFLGRHVVTSLLDRGHAVAGLAGGPSEHENPLKARYPDSFHSLRLGPSSPAEIAAWAPDTLVLLASYVPSSQPVSDPCREVQLAREGILDASLQAVEAARASVRHVVFASSVTVYGPGTGAPLDESAPCAPESPYSIFKLAAEQSIGWLCGRLGVTASLLRICQLYGPGERHGLFLQRVFVPRARAGEPLSLVRGGREEKTLLWVEDAALAVAEAVDRRAAGVFNIAPERPTAVGEIARLVVEASGRGSTVSVQDDGGPVPTHRYAVERARSGLGFVAPTSLAEGIGRLCNS
jgi:UDP-glucose 4-epimerase